MITIEIKFPAGRYHATPWGNHVNEGTIEWPPSPWRLLRAFLATGYAKLGWNGEGPPREARALIENLAAVLPRYRLPIPAATHSRHYMPTGELDRGEERKTLVFDTSAHMNGAPILVQWNAALNDDQHALLGRLIHHLGYLGRSESWVEARLIEGSSTPGLVTTIAPCAEEERPGPDWQQVSLLAPVPAADYVTWRQARISETLASSPNTTAAIKRRIEADFPRDLLDCIQVETPWLKARGWSQPPGSRKVLYWQRTRSLDVSPIVRARRRQSPGVSAVLLAMATQSGNANVLPSVMRTLPQAELLHRAAIQRVNEHAHRSSALSGKDDLGNPLQSHRHAHILPMDLDADGHLDHILIWAPMLLDANDRSAIRAVRRMPAKGLPDPLRLAIAAEGSILEFASIRGEIGRRLRGITGMSTTWISVTPFVPPRHPKKSGRNTIEGQVASELESRSLPQPASIEILDLRDPQFRRFRHFVRVRSHGPQPPVDSGFAVRIGFTEDVTGIIAIGYGSHFGLGLFGSA